MKIRNGFVSNSSSSSFVIAVKSGKKPTKAELLELFGVKPDSAGEQLLQPYFDLIKHMEKRTIKDVLDDYGYDTVEEYKKREGTRYYPRDLKLMEEGWTIFETTVSNEDYDNPIGAAIHMMDIDVKTPDVLVYHAGY